MPSKKAKPKFLRPNYGRKSRVRIKGNWRRQRGHDNKKRIGKAYMGASPSIGYGQDKRIRGHHPKGMPETLVSNLSELQAAPKTSVVRIAGSVGKRLKAVLLQEAQKLSLVVLNSGQPKKPVIPTRKAKPAQKTAKPKTGAAAPKPAAKPAEAKK